MLQEASAARVKLEAALEATRREAAAEGRRLRETVARAEAQEEALAARLLSSEMAAEEARRHYERRLGDAAVRPTPAMCMQPYACSGGG